MKQAGQKAHFRKWCGNQLNRNQDGGLARTHLDCCGVKEIIVVVNEEDIVRTLWAAITRSYF